MMISRAIVAAVGSNYDSASTPLMRKPSWDASANKEPLLGHMRFSRHAFRRVCVVLGGVLLLILSLRYLGDRSVSSPTLPSKYAISRDQLMAPSAPLKPKLNSVQLEVYMESQCPDTSRFLHNQLMKAWTTLSHTGRVELTLIPFGKARCIEKGNDFECSCQHGANECVLNQLMNCVIDRVGYPEKYVPIVDCIQGKPNMEIAMRTCIEPNAALAEPRLVHECALGPRGRRLLAMAGSRTVGLKPALNFVPWIMINGERNVDALYDLTENLCKALEPAPAECAVYEKKGGDQSSD